MDPTLIGNFIRFPSARDVWRAVVTAYFDCNDKIQVYNLRRQVTRLKQSDKPIEEYFNLLQETDFRRPNQMETSKDIETHNSLVQEERVYTFLDGLDDRLDNARAEVLRLEPFPTVEEAFAMIRQEDVRQTVMLEKCVIDASMAMVVREAKAPKNTEPADANLTLEKHNNQSRSRPSSDSCTHCGWAKHTKKTCFKLHGYPDWFKDLKKKKQQANYNNR